MKDSEGLLNQCHSEKISENLTHSMSLILKTKESIMGFLVKKCFDSLNARGRIVIQDWIMNNDRTQPASGAVFAINMLAGTEAGDCYTEQEVKEMLTAAGFKNISRTEFDSGMSQMTAQKI